MSKFCVHFPATTTDTSQDTGNTLHESSHTVDNVSDNQSAERFPHDMLITYFGRAVEAK